MNVQNGGVRLGGGGKGSNGIEPFSDVLSGSNEPSSEVSLIHLCDQKAKLLWKSSTDFLVRVSS